MMGNVFVVFRISRSNDSYEKEPLLAYLDKNRAEEEVKCLEERELYLQDLAKYIHEKIAEWEKQNPRPFDFTDIKSLETSGNQYRDWAQKRYDELYRLINETDVTDEDEKTKILFGLREPDQYGYVELELIV